MMKRSYLTKRFGLAAAACALCIAAGVGTTFAYYTDSTNAQGMLDYSADEPKTDIDEKIDDDGKSITLTNNSDVPCIVRVKLFFSEMNADVKITNRMNESQDENIKVAPGEWGVLNPEKLDGWIYFNEILWPGQTTSVLRAEISTPDAKTNALDKFKVQVVSQSVQARWSYENDADEIGSATGVFDTITVRLIELKEITDPITVPGETPTRYEGVNA